MSKILLFENTAQTQLSIADECLARDDLPSAIKAMRTAYDIDKDPALLIEIGEAYLHTGLVGAAFESFSEAYAKGFVSTQCLFGLSRAAYFLGYDKESADYFKKIFLKNLADVDKLTADVGDLGEEFVEVTGGMANRGFTFVGEQGSKSFDDDMVTMVREDPEKALPYFENVPKSSKLFYEARNNIALIKLMLGSLHEALEECNFVLAHKPNDVFALSTLLATYSAMGFRDKAVSIAEKLDGLAIVDEEDLRKVALAMCQAELHTYAVKYLDKLFVQRYERNVMLLKAIAYYNVGDDKRAIATVRDMRKLFPKDDVMLADVEAKIKAREEKVLPYSVIMMHGETLRHIGEARVLFGADKEDGEFNYYEFFTKLKEDKNYRLLYWYLTNHAYFCKNDEIAILFRLAQTGEDVCYDLICEVLRDFGVGEYLKCKCIRVLVCHGYDKKIHLLLGAKIRESKPLYPQNYAQAVDKGNNHLAWADAFAVAYSELFLRYEGFEEELKIVAEEVYNKIVGLQTHIKSPFALAAVMYKRMSAVGKIKVKDLCKIFGISSETLKKYETIINEDIL